MLTWKDIVIEGAVDNVFSPHCEADLLYGVCHTPSPIYYGERAKADAKNRMPKWKRATKWWHQSTNCQRPYGSRRSQSFRERQGYQWYNGQLPDRRESCGTCMSWPTLG